MKKILSVILSLGLVLFIGCSPMNADSSDGNSTTNSSQQAKCSHDYRLISSTATCTQDGEEIFECRYCYQQNIKNAQAVGHSYNKNVCSACGNTITDISQLNYEQIDELYDALFYVCPYTVDSDTLSASRTLYTSARKQVEDCTNALNAAKNQRPVRVYNSATGQWEYQINQKLIDDAQDDLDEAESFFALCEDSYLFNCKGFAWELALTHIKSKKASNASLKEKLAIFGATQLLSMDSESTKMPDWYDDIILSIKTIIGIDITAQ